jgi:hypothetical protein
MMDGARVGEIPRWMDGASIRPRGEVSRQYEAPEVGSHARRSGFCTGSIIGSNRTTETDDAIGDGDNLSEMTQE